MRKRSSYKPRGVRPAAYLLAMQGAALLSTTDQLIRADRLHSAVERRPGKRPILADLRDSGEIEQDADVITFLWPLGEDGEASRPTGCEIAKNRQGRTGSMVLELFGATQIWGESTRTLDQFDTKKRSGGFE